LTAFSAQGKQTPHAFQVASAQGGFQSIELLAVTCQCFEHSRAIGGINIGPHLG
jgi:hypothetical protein